jgi:hypothetical protein
MANVQDTGFRPLKLVSGGDVPVMRFKVAAASAVAMFIGDLVSVVNTGTVTPSTAADGYKVVGVVVGVLDSNGIACGSPGSSISTKYLPVSTAGYADVALATPDALFVANAGSTGLVAADVFIAMDHVATAGSTTTAKSGHVLDSGTKTNLQCTVIDLLDAPNNAWGAYASVVVRFSESYWNCATLVTPT